MTKYSFKYYCIILLLLCLSFHSTITLATSNTDIDKSITGYSNTLLDIQKQLKSVTRNAFVNIVNNESNITNKNQLDVFANQLAQTITDLNQLTSLNLTTAQNAKVQSLLTVASYMTYIQERNYDLLASKDPLEQYTLLNSIFIGHSLIDQIFSYTLS